MADQSAFAPLFDNAKPTDDQQLANLVRNGDTAATKAFLEKRNANQEALDAQKKQAEEAAATPEISEQESKRIDAINEIRTKPAAALANLHDNDDTAIVAKYRSNKELYDSDPVAKQRFLDAYKIARSQPFSIGSTIAGFGEGLIKLVPALAGSAAQVTKDVATGNGDKVVMAGILSAETTGQDLSKAKTNLFRLISSGSTLPKDDAGWQSDFDTAIKRDEFLDSTAHGGHVTHYSDKEAEEIQKDTLIADPLNFIPLEAGAGIITKVVKGSVAGEKVFQVVNKAREVIREIPVVSRGGQMIASMAKSARSLSENAAITAGSNLIDAGSKFGAVKGSTVGAIAEMAMRGVTNGIPGAGIIAGAAAPTILKSIGSALVNTGLKSKGLLPWGPVAHAAEAAVNNPLTRGAAGALGLHGDPLAAGFTGFSALVNADGNGKKLGEALGSNAAFGAAGGLIGAAIPEDKSAQPPLRTISALQQQAAAASAGHAQNPSQLSTLTAGQKSQQAAPTSSAGYGVFPGFDKLHQDNVSKLTPEAQDNINKFRETFRETGAQIYVLSPEEYATALVDRRAKELGRALTEDEAKQIVATDGATRGVFTDTLKDEKGKAQRVVLLNSEGSALGHETGHLVDSLLMPEDKAALRDQVSKSYTPEQIAEAKTAYEDQLGRPITHEQAIDELIAENFTKIISGVPIDQIGAPREVSTDLGRALEKAYASDTELGFKPDVNVGASISKTLANRPLDADVVPPSQAVPAAEVPLKPTAPTSAPTAGAIPLAAKKPVPAPAKDSNIRVTPEQQNQFSETRGSAPSDKGSVEAELALQDPKNGYTPKDRVTLNSVTESMGKPVEAEYHSVKSDKFGANRTERGEERAVPDAIRQTVQKIFVPYRTEVTSKGIQVLAMSLDKVRQNIDTLAAELTRKGATDLSPYAIRDGKFTDSEAFSLIKDIQTYLTNQESGFGGNGQKIIVPKDYYGTIPGEKPGAKPTQLSEEKAQFINALMGRDLGPPKTARATPNRPVPANVSARQLAEANKRPTEPSLLAKEGQEFSAAQGGGKITEMNPLRQAMVKRGVSVEGLHEITERLSLKDIRSVKARPDLRFAQPATDLIRAGFMPATAENKTAKFLYEDTYRTKSGEVKTVRYYQTPGTADHPRGMTVDEAGLRELGLRSEENRGSFMPATKEKESNLAEKYPDLNDIPKRHVPIEIEREDGSKYGAVMNGYYDLGGSKGSQPSVGRMIDGGWSHGMLRDGEKIVSAHPSPKEWDSQFSKTSFLPAAKEDFSKSNISGLLEKKDWAIMTAENPDGKAMSPEENATRNSQLESELKSKGLEFVPVRGKYGDNEEHSYAITGLDSNAALELGKKYGQESVLTSNGLEYANGDVKPARGVKVFDSKPDNFYSTLPDGTTFQVDIDFDAGKGKPLPESIDRDLKLVHLSSNPDLKKLGTEYFGKGMAHRRDLQGLPKVYFFEEGSPVGGDNFWTKGRKMYGAEVSGAKIYDGDKDSLGYWNITNREERDQMLIDKGYEGMAVKTADGRRTVSMFKDVDVKPLGTFEGGDKISAPVSKSTTSFAPRTPEQTAIATARAKANDYKERFPEAQPLTFAKDAEGHLKLDDEGKPRTVKTSYDLYNTPLAKQAGKGIKNEDKKSDAIAEAYSDGLVKQYDRIKDRPEVMAGANWYRVARTKIKSVFGDDSLLFAQLLGATSAQTPVADNFRQSIDAYRRFKAGDYDAMVTKYKEGLAKLADGSLMAESGAKTEPAAMKWWIDQHNLVPTKSNGKRYNANSHAVLRVLAGNWAETVAGPKTPNFAGNLAGTTLEATIDVWAARMLHRVGSEQEGKKWRILPDSETGVSDPDFYLGQAAYRKAAAKIGTNPDDLQAVLWFAEKDHWEKKGWTRGSGAEKSDFNYFLDRTKKEGDTAVLDEGKPKQEELALGSTKERYEN
jgi:hypothetical protein